MKLYGNYLTLLFVGFFLFGCKAIETEKNNYTPTSVEELSYIDKTWCGYEFLPYDGLPVCTELKTLFKVDVSNSGVVTVETQTVESSYNYSQDYTFVCQFSALNQMMCGQQNVIYRVNNLTLDTNLLNKLFSGMSMTRLSVCTKAELNNF